MGHPNPRPVFPAIPADLPVATISRERGFSRFDENGSRRLQAD